jgi:hypothetical protein
MFYLRVVSAAFARPLARTLESPEALPPFRDSSGVHRAAARVVTRQKLGGRGACRAPVGWDGASWT